MNVAPLVPGAPVRSLNLGLACLQRSGGLPPAAGVVIPPACLRRERSRSIFSPSSFPQRSWPAQSRNLSSPLLVALKAAAPAAPVGASFVSQVWRKHLSGKLGRVLQHEHKSHIVHVCEHLRDRWTALHRPDRQPACRRQAHLQLACVGRPLCRSHHRSKLTRMVLFRSQESSVPAVGRHHLK